MYPYSFRHFYGKNFIQKNNNLSLLADLMGHENINTTRIYTTLSTEEQVKILNETIDWD